MHIYANKLRKNYIVNDKLLNFYALFTDFLLTERTADFRYALQFPALLFPEYLQLLSIFQKFAQ